MVILQRLRDLLLKPLGDTRDQDPKLRPAWLTGFTLLVLCASVAGVTSQPPPALYLSIVLTGVFAVAYGLSRTSRYRVAVFVALGGILLQSMGAIALQGTSIDTPEQALFVYIWLVVPVGFSGLWLTARAVVALALFTVATLLLHALLIAEIGVLFFGPALTMLCIVSLLFAAIASSRERDMARLQGQSDRLRDAMLATQAAARAKSEFLANMSHELRTPMHAVQGMISLMTRDAHDMEKLESLTFIEQSGRALMNLINDILDYSKLDAMHARLYITAFSLRACVTDALDAIRPRAAEKGLRILFEWNDACPEFVCCDRRRLQQVLDNLLDNAVKFTERGDITLSVDMRPLEAPRLEGDATNEELPTPWRALFDHEHSDISTAYEIIFAVSDTGRGIIESARDTIFDVFMQGDTSATRLHGGTGLGLAISKRLVALMGGELGLESEVGVGSTFRFAIPMTGVTEDMANEPGVELEPSSEEPSRVDPLPGVDELANLDILLVEDNPLNQRVALSMLERLGCAADVAHDGKQAVDATREHEYDIVLMDVQMPVMDGLEATRRIRMNMGDETRPYIIAVTAHTLQGDREDCLDAGMNAYLGKPFRIDDLEQVLRRAARPG